MDGRRGIRLPLPRRVGELLVNADMANVCAAPTPPVDEETVMTQAVTLALFKLLLVVEAEADELPEEVVAHAAEARAIAEEWGLALPRLHETA